MKLIQRMFTRKSENGRKVKGVNLYLLSVLMILLSLVTSSAQGAAPMPVPDGSNAVNAVWDIQIIDGAPAGIPPFPLSLRYMTDRSLAVKSDNTPCVAFGGDYLFYSCWNAGAQRWDTEIVDSSHLVGAYAALAFDFSSRPFISYYDATNGNLKLAYNLGSGWEILVVDSNPLPYVIPGGGLPTPDEDASPELKALHKLEDSLFGNNQQINAPQQEDVISQVQASVGVGKHTSIALDTFGNVHISYYDEVNRDLKYAFWERFYAPFNWTIETVDAYSDQGVVGTYTSIAVDHNNRPHIAYMSEKYDDLKYARRSSGGGWQIFDVDTDQNVGTYASLALQVIGNDVYPHISYLDFTNYNLKYAYVGTDNQWKRQAVDTPGVVGLFTSIARGSDGKVWISYYDQTNGDLKYALITASTTTVKTIYKDGNVGFYTSIALNKSTNKPGIVYGDYTNNSLNYTYLNADNKWIASVINFASSVESKVGLNTSLSINGFGEPVISYRDASAGALKYARYFPPVWNVEFVNPSTSDGQHSSTAWIDDYHPAIAFYDQVQGDLIYAKWDSTSHSWAFEKVDTTGNVGQYVSLAIDANRNPHISYYDVSQGDLKYACWDSVNNSWKIDIVDPLGDVGYFTSLTLDVSGRPFISYYDKTNERIKYAYIRVGDAWDSFPLVKVGIDGDGIVVNDAFTSAALFDNGFQRFMRIAYYNDTQKDLMLAVANVEFPSNIADWTISTVDSPGNVGKFVSMSIEKGADNRHLCYYDESNGDLKYALWNGAWSLEIVESAGNVGQYCSIALNNAGEPAISYYDASLGKLKLARTFELPLARLYLPIIERE